MPRKTSDTSAIDKVCRVLRRVGEQPGDRLTEIARDTGLPWGTALRVLDALTRERFVERINPGKTYASGPETVAFARRASPEELRVAAAPGLARLARLLGDTALLSVASGLDALCLDRAQGAFPVGPVSLQPGARRMLGVGGGGLALLAFAPPARAEACLEVIPLRLADHPRLTLERIREDVAAARRDGHALAQEHSHDRVSAIGVPVRNADGVTVAALSVVSLTDRLLSRRGEIALALAEEAERLGRTEAAAGASGPWAGPGGPEAVAAGAPRRHGRGGRG
ncbi:transcriptional regulator, IclR family [Albimonas donghaensis]|uniref:Transcriptional regulator, IclR family n=1 Tax=Albimonas donghaensis TaxID=356660 RepID=A0A1H3F9Y4_9RHOB|nr:IclR family transcriptional regulator C-terminal domain-containing protein [Albimonas donghaensis]SDX87760.1 transcriptional regulator, IclR family [Albimonas donghaensis]